jgi:aspartate racemase
MKPLRKTVGILGGMGPEATVEFMRRLIASVPAEDDRDHLHMLVDNNPKVPSRIAALIEKAGENPAPVLAKMAKGLETAGADFLAMPCNTAHAYLPEIRAAIAIPVLDMIALSVEEIARLTPQPRAIGLLASPAARRLRHFEVPLTARSIEIVLATEEEDVALLSIIRSVKAGRSGQKEQAAFNNVAQTLAGRGAEVFIVACSEFSLLSQPQVDGRTVVDTLDVLVRETLLAAST